MLKQQFLFASGLFIILLSFIGIPHVAKMILMIITGILISYCALSNYYERKTLANIIAKLEEEIIETEETTEEPNKQENKPNGFSIEIDEVTTY